MVHTHIVSLLRLCITLCVLAPALAYSAVLENPSGGNFYSGVGVVSGWKCDADGPLTVRFYDVNMAPVWDPIPLAYPNERPDTARICGDTDNGFVAIWNWANLGDGTYTAVVDDNGVEFGRSTFTVTTLGEAFVTGAQARVTVRDFPYCSISKSSRPGGIIWTLQPRLQHTPPCWRTRRMGCFIPALASSRAGSVRPPDRSPPAFLMRT